MDNHDSQVSLEVITFAKENGIILLTIPPHTSHKLQPLDRTVYGPLKTFYNNACDNWMLSHPGKTLTIYEIAECLGHAFPLAFTPRNIESGFRVSGIWPLNADLFTDEDYLSSYVTDRDISDVQQQNLESTSHDVNNPELPENTDSDTLREIQIEENVDLLSQTDIRQQPCTSSTTMCVTPEMIKPHPKAAPRKANRKGRKS